MPGRKTSQDVSRRRQIPKTEKKKAKQARATIEDNILENDEDELGVEGRLLRKPARNTSRAVLGVLEKTAAVLSSFGNPEDVEELLENGGFQDADTVKNLQSLCETISDQLRSSTTADQSTIPSTINLYDKHFVLRGPSNQLFCLRPVEVFQGLAKYSRRKVLGWVQQPGSKFPLMFALPGSQSAENHPRLLDSEMWNKEVKRWGGFHNHIFKEYVFDKSNGKEAGDTYASHTEPRLMLWFSCYILEKLTGVVQSIREQIGYLFRIKDLKRGIQAELYLTEAPCKPCLLFQKLVEEYTGIKFTITVVPNVGHLKPKRDKYKVKQYSLYASDPESEDSEFEVVEKQTEIIKKTERKPAVVIPRRPATPSAASINNQKSQTPRLEDFTITKVSHGYQKRKIHRFMNPNFQHSQLDDDDDEESEWSPDSPPNCSSRKIYAPPKPTKKSLNHGLATPDKSPFGFEAREAVRLKKEKRRRERDSSPTPSKKVRRSKV
jgi:hypothetical protein